MKAIQAKAPVQVLGFDTRPYATKAHGCYQIRTGESADFFDTRKPNKIEEFKQRVGDRVFKLVEEGVSPVYL